jgi:DNA-binding NtrC family response regulator
MDADADIHATLANILNTLAWSVRHVPDNKTALTAAGATQFDLILTNEKTSGKEDVDLFRSLRSLHPHTRLIILTQQSTPADVLTSMREHCF